MSASLVSDEGSDGLLTASTPTSSNSCPEAEWGQPGARSSIRRRAGSRPALLHSLLPPRPASTATPSTTSSRSSADVPWCAPLIRFLRKGRDVINIHGEKGQRQPGDLEAMAATAAETRLQDQPFHGRARRSRNSRYALHVEFDGACPWRSRPCPPRSIKHLGAHELPVQRRPLASATRSPPSCGARHAPRLVRSHHQRFHGCRHARHPVQAPRFRRHAAQPGVLRAGRHRRSAFDAPPLTRLAHRPAIAGHRRQPVGDQSLYLPSLPSMAAELGMSVPAWRAGR